MSLRSQGVMDWRDGVRELNEAEARPKATPDTIIAHLMLLRAVDRMLACAEEVRAAKEVLQSHVDKLEPARRNRLRHR